MDGHFRRGGGGGYDDDDDDCGGYGIAVMVVMVMVVSPWRQQKWWGGRRRLKRTFVGFEDGYHFDGYHGEGSKVQALVDQAGGTPAQHVQTHEVGGDVLLCSLLAPNRAGENEVKTRTYRGGQVVKHGYG